MRASTISTDNLICSNTLVASAILAQSLSAPLGNRPTVPLRTLVSCRNEFVMPQSLGNQTVDYVGLDRAEPLTGTLYHVEPVSAITIRNRSKVFHRGDILFSKLRPSLGKVVHIDSIEQGVCSAEFYVLTPLGEIPGPVLAFLLRLPAARTEAAKYVAGTALPRIDISDILNLAVPRLSARLVERLTLHLARLLEIRDSTRTLGNNIYSLIESDFLRSVSIPDASSIDFPVTEAAILSHVEKLAVCHD